VGELVIAIIWKQEQDTSRAAAATGMFFRQWRQHWCSFLHRTHARHAPHSCAFEYSVVKERRYIITWVIYLQYYYIGLCARGNPGPHSKKLHHSGVAPPVNRI